MGKYSGKTCRLLSMLSMTASFFLVEIIVGYITNSVALVADSFHMLSDVVALIVGFSSVRISKWRTQKNTFGWARAEVLGALVNSVFLIALCFSILVEALKRLVEVEPIENPKLLLIVGGAGLLINIIGLFLFHNHGHSHGGGGGHGHSHGGTAKVKANSNQPCNPDSKSLIEQPAAEARTGEQCEENNFVWRTRTNTGSDINVNAVHDTAEIVIEFDENRVASSAQLNMRAVFLHVLGDALGSVIVIISACIIWFVKKDWVYYVDPAMSIVMVCIIVSTTIPLLKEAALILLQTVPTHIEIKEIKEKIEKLNGVQAVHEFHLWQLAGNRIIASAHIRCHNVQEYMSLASEIKEIFHDAGVHSTTIQPEFSEDIGVFSSKDCVLACGPEKQCYPATCCAQPKNKSNKSSRDSSPKANGTTVPRQRLLIEDASANESAMVENAV